MLNNEALSELSKLKKIIEDSKDLGEGTVSGSQGRYGFVKLDDGRSIYLPAEEMQRVLPGDRVQVEVISNDKNKQEAKLQELLKKNFKRFVGTYTIKGNNHFVIPDHRETNRGLFVPPKERRKFQEGDFVYCQVIRHPFADGKSQAKILEHVGPRDSIGIEHRFIEFKYQLKDTFQTAAEKQAIEISEAQKDWSAEDREDLSHLTFVTIDAENTTDLDDALYAESADETWTLYSAIADPGALVEYGSPLDKEAHTKASSVYFPGKILPMFPKALANTTFSLLADEKRPALVCRMTIDQQGMVTDQQFFSAIIQSKAKLSYQKVAAFIDNSTPLPSEAIAENITHLAKIAELRRRYRSQHCVLQDDNIDYHFDINDKMKIESIEKRFNTSAHRIVEEAMLVTNQCAGREFSSQKIDGALYSSHDGFREERLNEIKHLLKLEKPDYPRDAIDSFEGFTQLIRDLDEPFDTVKGENDQQIKIRLRRLLQGAELSSDPKPHFALGFDYYALITSPIRRYQDLHNQRLLKQHLAQSTDRGFQISGPELQEKLINIRNAQRELDQRLLCQFLSDKVGSQFDAKIMAIGSQGLALRLADNGAESFLQLRNGPKLTVKYDSIRLTLTVNDCCYQIEQVISVNLDKVDLKNYKLQLSLATNV